MRPGEIAGIVVAVVLVLAILGVAAWGIITHSARPRPHQSAIMATTVRPTSSLLTDTQVNQLYQMLKDFDDVMAQHGIPYVIEGGTLLGAVRHGGLMAWDDDVDVHVQDKHEARLLSKAAPHLKRLGYDVYAFVFGYKMKREAAARGDLPFLDIFISSVKNGRTVLHSGLFSNCYFTAAALNDTRYYAFGPLSLPGPVDAAQYLNTCYGDKWPREVVKTGGHGKGGGGPAAAPATVASPCVMPTAPLVDRVRT